MTPKFARTSRCRTPRVPYGATSLLLLASCSLVDLGGLTGGGVSRDGGSLADAGTRGDAALVADSSPGDSSPTDTGTGACPGKAGATAVLANTSGTPFCVDTREATNADYASFLAAKGNDTSGQPATCKWNTSFVPGQGWPVGQGLMNYPVSYVDWCDAYAYCAWAGKRLCGAIGGGPTQPSYSGSPHISQWMNACSENGAKTFPYGNTYDMAACDTNGSGPIAAGSAAGCQGGFPGLYDMSGNVEEWEDSCSPDASDPTGASDKCVRRGGSWNDGTPVANYQCTSALANPRNAKNGDAGFRCCGP